jgi:hypothetical protein
MIPRARRSDLRRATPSRRSNELFLVLHEPGAQADYLQWIKRVLRHHHIDLFEMDSEPPELQVLRAAGLRDKARKQGARYDQAWCVFNANERGDLTSAIEKARAANIELAVAMPTFDHWLLLHFQDLPLSNSGEDAIAALQAFVPGYAGSLWQREQYLFHRYNAARDRAMHVELGSEAPTIHKLIDAIVKSREDFLDGPHGSAL